MTVLNVGALALPALALAVFTTTGVVFFRGNVAAGEGLVRLQLA